MKQYFTEPKVLAGLFKVIETLFDVSVKPDTAPVWHEDVRFFRLENAGRRAGRPVLPRPLRPRQPSAAAPGWTMPSRAPAHGAGGIQTPVAYLNCNFSRPVGGKPATASPTTK